MEIAITFQGKATTMKALARDHGLSYGTLYWRWTDAGKPSRIPETLLAPPDPLKMRRKSKLDRPVKTQRTVKTYRIEEAYADPNFLPHIPLGDLAHLSATKNTGAARKTSEA